MSTELEKYKESGVFALDEVVHQKTLINEVFREVMKENIHYGVIPGTQKPTIYKAGAECISFMFRLSASYECEYRDLPDVMSHREVIATCTLTHIPSGQIWGQAIGSCSTMEGKYRFRTGEVTLTDKPVPREYWDDRDIKLIGGKGHATKKDPDTGKWMIAIAGKKVEHDNPADYYNTILKMAQKRAFNSANIACTAASDIFTVDVEDMPEVIPGAAEMVNKQTGEVVDVTPVETKPKSQPAPESTDDEAEADWKREEAQQAEQAGKGEQASIPEDPPKNEYSDKPPPKNLKVSKQRGNILFAKWKNIPDYTQEEKDVLLKDLGYKSMYEVPDSEFDKIKDHLDLFYKK